VLIVVLALTCCISVAFAANNTYGTYKSFTVDGSGYRNRSIVYYYSFSNTLQPRTEIGTDPYQTLPAGYLGANCRLYKESTGALVGSTGYMYTDSSCVSCEFGADSYSGTSGAAYYSFGVSRVYSNGNYTTTDAYKSPSTNL